METDPRVSLFEQFGSLIKDLGGAALVGLGAAAIWWQQENIQNQIFIGLGIGAALKYGVSWLDLAKRRLMQKWRIE